MQHGLLNRWVNETAPALIGKIITDIEQFEDQMQIKLLGIHEFLQLNLMNKDTFAFITTKPDLPFQTTKDTDSYLKHINGSTIQSVDMDDRDRILYITLIKINMYQDKIRYRLIFEMIPTFQNLILTRIDHEKEIVMDALRKFSLADNPHRQILPGSPYMLPPSISYSKKEERLDYPLEISDKGKIVSSNFEKADKTLSQLEKRNQVQSPIERCPEPVEGKGGRGDHLQFNQMNPLFELLFYDYYLNCKKEDIKSSIIKNISNEINKLERKLVKQDIELDSAKDETTWFHYAELLKANFAHIKPGMNSLHVTDYFTDGFPEIEISLKTDKSPRLNMEYYVRKYKKARSGREIIEKNIADGKQRLLLLKEQIRKIEETDSYLNLRQEVGKKGNKSSTQVKTLFRRLIINENWEILIGRSSKENDLLSLHTAKPQDWWFHTRIYQGTHVVLRNYKKQELPEDLKFLCSQLAAYYSKAKTSSQVPVDYTQVRYIRKPRGSAPGYVTYSHQHTIFVDPMSYREAAFKLHEVEIKDPLPTRGNPTNREE